MFPSPLPALILSGDAMFGTAAARDWTGAPRARTEGGGGLPPCPLALCRQPLGVGGESTVPFLYVALVCIDIILFGLGLGMFAVSAVYQLTFESAVSRLLVSGCVCDRVAGFAASLRVCIVLVRTKPVKTL